MCRRPLVWASCTLRYARSSSNASETYPAGPSTRTRSFHPCFDCASVISWYTFDEEAMTCNQRRGFRNDAALLSRISPRIPPRRYAHRAFSVPVSALAKAPFVSIHSSGGSCPKKPADFPCATRHYMSNETLCHLLKIMRVAPAHPSLVQGPLRGASMSPIGHPSLVHPR